MVIRVDMMGMLLTELCLSYRIVMEWGKKKIPIKYMHYYANPSQFLRRHPWWSLETF